MTRPAALIGVTLGSYELQALLGSGGMASVYRALDLNLQRPVAVKVLSAALAADPAYVERFRREARLIANLRHPNVVHIYAFGEHQGLLYMVQELLPGVTLERRIADLTHAGHSMARDEVLAIVADLAAALDAAHAVGVIHRDVKPGNAIANAQGRMVLTDFGIARSTVDATQTATGILLGTPGYVAPEQAVSNTGLTAACDIYALGVVTFELLTGRRPFEGDTPTAIVLKHLYDAPPAPSMLRPGLPPALDAVVLRALAKEPAARFPQAGALAQALVVAWPAGAAHTDIHNQQTHVWMDRPAAAPLAAQAVTSAAPHSPRLARRSRWVLPILSLVLLLGFTAGALLAWRQSAESAPEAAPVAEPTASAVVVAAPTLSAAPTALPILESTVIAAPTVLLTLEPTAIPEPTVAPTATAEPTLPPTEAPASGDPLTDLGVLISAGLADGSAGDDAPEYLQRYGELAQAIGEGDKKKAEEQLRELSRKIAERARERKLDAEFNSRAQALLIAVAEQYKLKRPPRIND